MFFFQLLSLLFVVPSFDTIFMFSQTLCLTNEVAQKRVEHTRSSRNTAKVKRANLKIYRV